jgi:hypothetical protein
VIVFGLGFSLISFAICTKNARFSAAICASSRLISDVAAKVANCPEKIYAATSASVTKSTTGVNPTSRYVTTSRLLTLHIIRRTIHRQKSGTQHTISAQSAKKLSAAIVWPPPFGSSRPTPKSK